MTTNKKESHRLFIPRYFAESILLLIMMMTVLWFQVGAVGAKSAGNSNTNTPATGGTGQLPADLNQPQHADPQKKVEQQQQADPTATATPSPSPTPYVPENGVREAGKEPKDGAGMGDILVVTVANLDKLISAANCKNEDGTDKPGCEKQKILLYLDDRPIKGLEPESGAPNPTDGTLRFHLQRTAESDESWADLLGAPPIFSGLFHRPMTVSVGLEDGRPIKSAVTGFQFIRVHEWLFWPALVGLLALLIAMFVLARKSNLLRDDIQPVGENVKGEETDFAPYSLGRVQMAFWFFLIVSSFLFVFVITWQLDTVTEQALALMGISAATALGAVVVDANKKNNQEPSDEESIEEAASQYPQLRTRRLELQQRIKELREKKVAGTATHEDKNALTSTQAELKKVKTQIKDVSTVSQGFLDDLLTDIHGYSFHRFQIFVWTIVLGIIFLHGVYNRLAMPLFSATLLALLGISGATYIGFKIPEQQQPVSPTENADDTSSGVPPAGELPPRPPAGELPPPPGELPPD